MPLLSRVGARAAWAVAPPGHLSRMGEGDSDRGWGRVTRMGEGVRPPSRFASASAAACRVMLHEWSRPGTSPSHRRGGDWAGLARGGSRPAYSAEEGEREWGEALRRAEEKRGPAPLLLLHMMWPARGRVSRRFGRTASHLAGRLIWPDGSESFGRTAHLAGRPVRPNRRLVWPSGSFWTARGRPNTRAARCCSRSTVHFGWSYKICVFAVFASRAFKPLSP